MSFPSYNKIAAALISTAFAATAFAQSSGFGPAPAVPAADRKFIEEALMGGMVEVELGKISQQKAQSDGVKKFGARMMQDHSKAGDELKALASSRNVPAPTALNAKEKKRVDELAKSKRFDHEYMEDMVADHKKDIADFRKEAQGGKDPDVKAWAAKTLPTLEDHLKQAEATRAALK